MLLLETKNEKDESSAIQQKRDDSVESDERIQPMRFPQQHAEVIDRRLPVKIIITRKEKVPRVYAEPRQVVTPVDGVSDRDQFVVTLEERYGGEEGHLWEYCRPRFPGHSSNDFVGFSFVVMFSFRRIFRRPPPERTGRHPEAPELRGSGAPSWPPVGT